MDLPVSGQITHASVETPYLALCVSVSLTERSNGHDTRPISDQTPPA
ncbi:AraC family transcriptional regulator [Bombella favorum]|nr:AraC family transcriptional regulator [Bombella favorum]